MTPLLLLETSDTAMRSNSKVTLMSNNTINDLASTQLDHIARLLAAAQRILDGHPACDLIALVQTKVEVLANDIDVLAEAAEY